VLATHLAYARALAGEGNRQEAFTEMKAVLDEQKEMLGPDHVEVASTLRVVGGMAMQLGDPKSGVESLTEALRISLAAGEGKPTVNVAATRINLGSVLFNAHRYEAAMIEWHEADLAFAALAGPDSDAAQVSRSGVALCLARLGRLADADAIFSELARTPPPDAVGKAFFDGRLGLLRSAQGRHEEALALLRAAPDLQGDSARLRALALGELGEALVTAGRAEESLPILREAQTILRQELPNDSPDLADIALNLARAHLALGRANDALEPARYAVAFWSGFDSKQRDTGVALLWQSRALAASGQAQSAADAVRQASAILASTSLPADRALLHQTQREIRL
jgi:tetratricopeptide (TPR) repeat protein